MINHKIDYYACHGDIKPDRECNSRYFFMSVPVLSKGAVESQENHGYHHRSQNDMGDENE